MSLYPKLESLLGCVADSMTEPPDRRFVAPGNRPPDDFLWDDDRRDESLWVRVASLFPSTTFPDPDREPRRLAAPLAAVVEVGVSRCVATVDDLGFAPGPDVMSGEAGQVQRDAWEVWRGIVCCGVFDDVVVGEWRPEGPLGGVVAGVWPVTVRV